MTTEFHDLSEKILNTGSSYWGNLGFWKSSSDYSSACCALAEELAKAAQLNQSSNVFDAGFGCGDQLLLWLQKYEINSLQGINFSKSQTHLAQQRLIENGFAKTANNLKAGSVADMDDGSIIHENKNINTVLALDCAYHFPSRIQFFESSYETLAKSGCIGLTDIVLSDKQSSIRQRFILNVMLFLSRIPKNNIVSLDAYKGQLMEVGFENINAIDISDHVFSPFGHWLAQYKKGEGLVRNKSKRVWLKYDVTAKFLQWAHRNDILRYVIITADKTS